MRYCECGNELIANAKKLCPECARRSKADAAKRWKINHPAKAKEMAKQAAIRRRATPEHKAYMKQYQAENKDRIRAYNRNRRKENSK